MVQSRHGPQDGQRSSCWTTSSNIEKEEKKLNTYINIVLRRIECDEAGSGGHLGMVCSSKINIY